MIDPQAQRILAQVSDEVCQLFAPDLVSLVLYGSAAGADFIPQRSDLNLAIVLNRVTIEHLRKLHGKLAQWHTQRVATPLLIDRDFLQHACDVFPMELFDMQGQHRILWGDDVIAPLRLEGRHLRYQAEHEARSKLLRLRAMYAEFGDDAERLRTLLRESVKTFVLLLRNLLHLRTGEHLLSLDESTGRFEEVFEKRLPALRKIQRMKREEIAWPSDLHELFAAYLAEVEVLVALIDHLPVERV